MTVLQPTESASQPGRELLNIHPSEDEWETYLCSALRTKHYRVKLRGHRRMFVRRYPDLQQWLQRPLRERVGWNPDKRHLWRDLADGIDFDAARVNYAARPYLLYLGFSGRLELDPVHRHATGAHHQRHIATSAEPRHQPLCWPISTVSG